MVIFLHPLIQLSNKLAKGLFNKAIMMSGAGLQRFIMKPVKPDDSKTFWDLVIKNAGVGSAKELKELDPKTLYYAWFDAQKQMKGTMKYTLPVADGEIITDDSYSSKTIPDMPYILGVTTEDMIPACGNDGTVRAFHPHRIGRQASDKHFLLPRDR